MQGPVGPLERRRDDDHAAEPRDKLKSAYARALSYGHTTKGDSSSNVRTLEHVPHVSAARRPQDAYA
jgi:hypothetical protein